MPLIGITGGIATGKSTVAEMFRRHGAILLSADDAARRVTEPGSPALKEIEEAFGPESIRSDGKMDREAVGRRIFDDPVARRRLEQITHPRILRLMDDEIQAARRANPPGALIAVEAPLLYEAGMEDWFDAVVVVTAPEELQIQRLRNRTGLDREAAIQRIRSQLPTAEKAARARIVIDNGGSRRATERQLLNILRQL
jgi:dephospho-CoA kinase